MGKRQYLIHYVWVINTLKNNLIASLAYLLGQNKFPDDPQMSIFKKHKILGENIENGFIISVWGNLF